jgi:hypothetical protein
VDRSRLNNVLIDQPLSRTLAEKIIRRYPGVSADFLFLGQSGGHLNRELEQQLLDYEKKNRDFCIYILGAAKEQPSAPSA